MVHDVEGSDEYDRTGTDPLWDDPNLQEILAEIQVIYYCIVTGPPKTNEFHFNAL